MLFKTCYALALTALVVPYTRAEEPNPDVLVQDLNAEVFRLKQTVGDHDKQLKELKKRLDGQDGKLDAILAAVGNKQAPKVATPAPVKPTEGTIRTASGATIRLTPSGTYEYVTPPEATPRPFPSGAPATVTSAPPAVGRSTSLTPSTATAPTTTAAPPTAPFGATNYSIGGCANGQCNTPSFAGGPFRRR